MRRIFSSAFVLVVILGGGLLADPAYSQAQGEQIEIPGIEVDLLPTLVPQFDPPGSPGQVLWQATTSDGGEALGCWAIYEPPEETVPEIREGKAQVLTSNTDIMIAFWPDPSTVVCRRWTPGDARVKKCAPEKPEELERTRCARAEEPDT